mgnify:FL=1
MLIQDAVVCVTLLLTTASFAAKAQTQPVPRPFPTLSSPESSRSNQKPDTNGTPADNLPIDEVLGVPIYPNASYLGAYDAGRGQTFHLFGTNVSFQEMVSYYSTILDERGDRVFDAPATHQFDTARFRDDEMTYRPSVTIKDYTWNGSEGYLNPVPGADPARYQTVIQIATAPPGNTDR